jgi:hypothetical protein
MSGRCCRRPWLAFRFPGSQPGGARRHAARHPPIRARRRLESRPLPAAEAARGAPLLALRRAAPRDPERVVERDVDLAMQPRDPMPILGPNGSAKRTLLLTLPGLSVPLAGERWARPPPRVHGAQPLGSMPQNFPVDPVCPAFSARSAAVRGAAAAAQLAGRCPQ